MRWIFPIFLCLAQWGSAQWTDTFDDGNFTAGPAWQGSSSKFIVNNLGRLQLAAPAESSEAWLFTSGDVADEAVWQFDVAMQFDPSSLNYCRVYLMADRAEPSQVINGFYIMLGGADDEVSLYRIVNGAATKVIDGANGRLAMPSVAVSVKATYSRSAGWELWVKTADGWLSEGITDFKHDFGSRWFGVYCKYSATRSDKFWFDNFVVTGNALKDRISPKVESLEVKTSRSIWVRFTEPIDAASLTANDFSVQPLGINPANILLSDNKLEATLHFAEAFPTPFNGNLQLLPFADISGNLSTDTLLAISYERVKCLSAVAEGNDRVRLAFSKPMGEGFETIDSYTLLPGSVAPISVSRLDAATVVLSFANPLQNKTQYAVGFGGLVDQNGDTLLQESIGFAVFDAARHDVVISELMVDAEPANLLPPSVFVEITNCTDYDLNLGGFVLMVGDRKCLIDSGSIKARSAMCLIGSADSSKWKGFDNICKASGLQFLNRSSGSVVLLSPKGTVLDAVEFGSDWLRGHFKDDGGWSFERIDNLNFSGVGNWDYSVDLSGGTPGMSNSIAASNPDVVAPYVRFMEVDDSSRVTLHFSEPLDVGKIIDTPLTQPSLGNAEIGADTLFCKRITVVFDEDMTAGNVYQLTLPDGWADFAGNRLSPYFPLQFGLPDTLKAGDVVINEILFDPRPDGSDFIEIKNRSAKIVLLSDIRFSKMNGDVPEKLVSVSDYRIPVLPDSYWTFSPQSDVWVEQSPSPWWLVNCTALPSMPNDEGDIAITTTNGMVIDRVAYSAKWHFPLLKSTEGVSLERIYAEWTSQDADNWHSAASTTNYATPTAPNSQAGELPNGKVAGFKLSPEVFTPNNDGNEDVLMVEWNSQKVGRVATVKVFDGNGNLVATLANNYLLANNDFIKWDGSYDGGKLAAPGIYVVLCRSFGKDGSLEEERLVCVLSGAKN